MKMSVEKPSNKSFQVKTASKGWQKILLYIVIAYLVLLLAPVAGFDLPRIIGEIRSNPALLVQQLLIGLYF